MYVYMISNIPINISLNLHFQTNPSYLNRICWLKISCILYIYIWLVVLTILKNKKVNGKDYPFFIMENKKWLKPPTR